MAKDKLDEMQRRKQELEVELDQLQNVLDDSIDQVKADVRTKLDLKGYIRKYPLQITGAAAFIGFMLGSRRSSSGTKKTNDKSSGSGDSNPLVQELKKLASKKAVSLATHFIESKIQAAKEKNT